MNSFHAFFHIAMAELLRFRATRIIAKVDRLIARAGHLKDRAAWHDADHSAPVRASVFLPLLPWLCGLLLAVLLLWLVHDAWK